MSIVIEVKKNKIFDIINKEQNYKVLLNQTDGLEFLEGPIWNREKDLLLFSDIAGNKMYQWSEKEGIKEWSSYSFKANGNAYLSSGDVVTCEHATSRIVKRNKAGNGYTILADAYQGKELNSPNDVVVRSDGKIYFTDPYFGRNSSRVGVERKQQLGFQGVYMYDKDQLVLIEDGLETPNGLCFSHDEKRLFINDSKGKAIWVFDVDAKGMLSNKKLWAETYGEGLGLPDGMKLDQQGNLYCCAQGGIHIFDSSGEYLGRICFPIQVANFTFGGKEGKDLFICATHTLYHMQGKVSGFAK